MCKEIFQTYSEASDSFSEVVAVAASDLLRCLIRRLCSDFSVTLIFEVAFFLVYCFYFKGILFLVKLL